MRPHYAPHIDDPDPPNPHMSDEEIEASARAVAEWMRGNAAPIADFDPNEPRDPQGRWARAQAEKAGKLAEAEEALRQESLREHGEEGNARLDELRATVERLRSHAGPDRSPTLFPFKKGLKRRAREAIAAMPQAGGVIKRAAREAVEIAKERDDDPPPGWREGLKLYHGTADDAAKHILTHGLIAHKSPGGDVWAAKHGMALASAMMAGGRKVSVYMTPEKGFAAQFANLASHERHAKPILFEVTVPPDKAGNLKPDEYSRGVPAYRYEGEIPPEWIRRVPLEEASDLVGRLPSVIDAAQPNKIYMVVFADESEEGED